MVVACHGEDRNIQQSGGQNWQQRTLSSRSSSQSKDCSQHYHCDSTNHMEAFINSFLNSRDSLRWVLMPSDGVYDSPLQEMTRYDKIYILQMFWMCFTFFSIINMQIHVTSFPMHFTKLPRLSQLFASHFVEITLACNAAESAPCFLVGPSCHRYCLWSFNF